MDTPRLRILFLCTGNACRSQMAEGLARALRADVVEAFSAGVERHGMNPRAVQVMAEAGIDISAQASKTLDDLPSLDFDYVITLCDLARGRCPHFAGGATVVHRGFPDPPRLAADAAGEEETLGHYRRVRDMIRDFVLGLPGSLPPRRTGPDAGASL